MSVEDSKSNDLNEELDQQNEEPELVEQELVEESSAEPDVNEALAQEVAEMKDQVIRAQAEMQNVRRRAEKDVEKAHKFGLEKFAKELLPVIDSLEKALETEVASENATTPLREGVEMTLSMFLGSVEKFGLEQVDPVGHPFDPALHEAMTMIDAPDAEPNTVVAAVQKGYTLSGRLVRPAMVVVAKG